MKTLIFCLIFPFLFSSCTYLKYASIQAEYSRIQRSKPGQLHIKHMIDKEKYFVIGKTIDEKRRFLDKNLTIAAYSSKFQENERVDTMHFSRAGTHFGLNLPEGIFTLLVFADIDGNNIVDQTEVVGKKAIQLNDATVQDKGLVNIDIPLTGLQKIGWKDSIHIPEVAELEKSLFYPAGTIRSLDDPIFNENMATLGMYDPASFSEKVPTTFFALEEDLGYKIPVVFVHGIGGSPRAFLPILNHLDRERYKPWFYYYASGGDLEQLGSLFYKIFLSGKVAHLDEMPMIIVAHSMGGLVVREALNKLTGKSSENRVKLFVSIATPFGGHPAAVSGEEHGLIVLPSWRDVNPSSEFLHNLYRKPLPKSINHQLFYAYQNPDTLKLSDNSDGVVPLSSQLFPVAQKQSSGQFGYDSSHTGILEDEEMIANLFEQISKVKNYFPEEHLQYIIDNGGYDVKLDENYSPFAKYFIHHYGKYAMAIANESLATFYPYQKEFIKVANGEMAPRNELEEGWVRFLKEFPELRK